MQKRIHKVVALVLLVISTFVLSANVMGTPVPEGENESNEVIRVELLPGDKVKVFNYLDGYSLQIPSNMEIDSTRSSVVTEVYNENCTIDIFHEEFPQISVNEYITYSNAPIKRGTDPVKIIKETSYPKEDKLIHQLWWVREELAGIENDKNYYALVDIEVSEKEVYTLHFKGNSLQWLENNLEDIILSFETLEAKVGTSNSRPVPKPRKYPLTTDAQELLNNITAKQKWGIFENSAPDDFTYLRQLERYLDYKFEYLLVYTSMGSKLPLERLNKAGQDGRYLEYTLQTLLPGEELNNSIMYDLLNGEFDMYLHLVAHSIAEYNKPVLFRLNNEMNGDWCGYSAYYSSRDADLYVASWRYLYEIFREEGADNALWVWNPNDKSFPNFKWNHSMMYYPGDEYVDIIGMTGYNTGNYYPGEYWEEFKEIYDPLYGEYTRLFPSKPFIITEFGANSQGGDKAAWIKDAFRYLPNYPKIGLAVWWNGIDWDQGKKARIYRLEENGALEAFKEGLQLYK